jgi:DNA-binding PadR family transcriptional regulator
MTGRHHGFGHGGWGGPRGFGGHRRRMRRGDVRAALLVLLADQPQTGYGLMEEIDQRSGGAWRPSPGSVYPTLQQLEDEGLVTSGEGKGRQPYELTDEGRTYVEENREELGEPWAKLAEGIGEGRMELRGLLAQIATAAYQVGTAGDDAQVTRANELLEETRRGLYRILAGDEPAE